MNNDDSLVNDENLPGPGESRRIAYLVAGYLEDNLTPFEQLELDDWLKENERNQRIFADLIDLKKLERQFRFTDQANKKATWARISDRINKKEPHRIPVWKYVAAASIVILIGFAIVLLLNTDSFRNEKPVAVVPAPGVINPGDIDPGSNRATLLLGNGRKVLLNDSIEQPIASGITNVNGQLLYAAAPENQQQEWHVLNTPRGGGYLLILPDQSKVWLNASSSLRFPAAFNGGFRKVELKGEAYFEVQHNKEKPFIVSLENNKEVTVLGTSFNINAYGDEPLMKTTLLTGKVRVGNANDSRQVSLMPGQQARIGRDGKMNIVSLSDAGKESAWHTGAFEFTDADIETIMRSVARWYDAEVIYKAKPIHLFNASISRDVPVSKLLQLLQMTGRVHFEINDRKITVAL